MWSGPGGGGVVVWSRGEGGVVVWSRGREGGRSCDLVSGRPPPPPPPVGQTNACENITFARFATRAVIKWPNSEQGPTIAERDWLPVYEINPRKILSIFIYEIRFFSRQKKH